MECTFLGTGQLHPSPRAQAGLLLEDVPLLIDCGAGTYQRLFESTASVDDVEHILFTHLHDDHISDIIPILNAKRHAGDRPYLDDHGRRDGHDQSPVRIYGPPGTQALFEAFLSALLQSRGELDQPLEFPIDTDSLYIEINEITPGSTFRIEDFEIDTRNTQHTDFATLAYKFDDELVVSGDTVPLDRIGAFAEGTNVLVHECSFFEYRDSDGHTIPEKLAAMLDGRDIDELYLTHLVADTPAERRATIEIIRQRFDGNVTLPDDLDRFSTQPEPQMM